MIRSLTCFIVCVMLRRRQQIFRRSKCQKRDINGLNEDEDIIMDDNRENN